MRRCWKHFSGHAGERRSWGHGAYPVALLDLTFPTQTVKRHPTSWQMSGPSSLSIFLLYNTRFLKAGKTEIKEPAKAVFGDCPCSGSQRVPSSCVCTLWENDMSQGSLYFPPNFPFLQSHLLLKVTSHNVIVLGTKGSKLEHSGTYSFKEAYVGSMLQ